MFANAIGILILIGILPLVCFLPEKDFGVGGRKVFVPLLLIAATPCVVYAIWSMNNWFGVKDQWRDMYSNIRAKTPTLNAFHSSWGYLIVVIIVMTLALLRNLKSLLALLK
jgi:hypothetical protein